VRRSDPEAELHGLFRAIRTIKKFLGDRILQAAGNVMDREVFPIIQSAASPIRDRRPCLTGHGRPAY
jgi:hypothetical protein